MFMRDWPVNNVKCVYISTVNSMCHCCSCVITFIIHTSTICMYICVRVCVK